MPEGCRSEATTWEDVAATAVDIEEQDDLADLYNEWTTVWRYREASKKRLNEYRSGLQEEAARLKRRETELANLKKIVETIPRPVDEAIEGGLAAIGVCLGAHFGGEAMCGEDAFRICEGAAVLCDSVEKACTSSQRAHIAPFRVLLIGLAPIVRDARRAVVRSEEEHKALQERAAAWVEQYQDAFPDVRITEKLHAFQCHLPPAYFAEEGCESAHKDQNALKVLVRSIRNGIKREMALMEALDGKNAEYAKRIAEERRQRSKRKFTEPDDVRKQERAARAAAKQAALALSLATG
jgi:hypothetical protein